MTSSPHPTDKARHSFAGALLDLHRRADDGGEARAILAELRRGLTDPYHPLVLRAAGPFLPPNARGHDLDAHLMTAVLFARMAQGRKSQQMPRVPEDAGRFDLGASARLLRLATLEERGLRWEDRVSLDLRFAGLLDRRFEDVFVPLRQLIHLLASKDVPVDFRVLLYDLRELSSHPKTVLTRKGHKRPYGPREVRRRWAGSYWRPPTPPPKKQASDKTSTPS